MSIQKGDRGSMTMGVCYRNPSASKEEEEDLLKEVSYNCKGRVLIMGDFNFGDIKWETLQADTLSSRKFMDIVIDLFLI